MLMADEGVVVASRPRQLGILPLLIPLIATGAQVGTQIYSQKKAQKEAEKEAKRQAALAASRPVGSWWPWILVAVVVGGLVVLLRKKG